MRFGEITPAGAEGTEVELHGGSVRRLEVGQRGIGARAGRSRGLGGRRAQSGEAARQEADDREDDHQSSCRARWDSHAASAT